MNSFDATKKPEDDLIICRCEGVNLRQIQSAIKLSGAQTVNQVKKLTRAGMGLCQGRTCAKAVESILDSEGQSPPGTEQYQARPPVRGVALAVLANGADQFDEPSGPISVALTRGADDDSAK